MTPFSIRIPFAKVLVALPLSTRKVSTRRPFAKVLVAVASTVRTSATESVLLAERCSATVSMLFMVELAVLMKPAPRVVRPSNIAVVDAPVEMLVYPNPFSESATVQFTLRKAEKVSIGIYNLVGQEILMVNEGTLSKGDHKITIDGSDLVQGIYFVNVKVRETSYLKRIIHTK